MEGAPEETPLLWRKSSRSSDTGNCVEIASTSNYVAVRDSKDPEGPVLQFAVDPWRDFVRAIRDDAFTPPVYRPDRN